MNRCKLLALLVLTLLLAGCAPRYLVDVNGYTAGADAGGFNIQGTFHVIPPKDLQNPLLAAEVARKIGILLVAQGCTLAPADKADYQVSAFYSISSATQAMYDPMYWNSGRIWMRGAGGDYWLPYDNAPSVSFVPVAAQAYLRRLVVRVNATKEKDGKRPVLWVGDAWSKGGSADLRQVLNYLLVAVFEYLGQDTGQAALVTVLADDPAVKQLMSGQPPTPAPADQ